MVQSSSKATDVSDDTTAHDEHWLISCNTIVLQFDENLLNVLDVLVDLVATVDELDQLDAVVLEVLLELFAEVNDNLVVDESNTSAEWLVYVSQNSVAWVQDSVGDLDGSSQSGAHDGFDGLRVRSSQGETVAVSVDRGRVHGVRVD